MPIPTFDQCFRPFLVALGKHSSLHMKDLLAAVAAEFKLTPMEIAQRLPSGKFTVIANRMGWARTYLSKAGLIENVSRGVWKISAAGRVFLAAHSDPISLKTLRTIPVLQAWLTQCSERVSEEEPTSAPPVSAFAETPEDNMHRNEHDLRALVSDDLRERVAAMTPQRFEWLVEQLVVKLGYGSSADEVMAALRSGAGDSGVDGVIKEDRLGLGQIYLQAKRWQHKVGRPEIQAFVGAMHGRAQKGVFITTSEYTREALEYAASLQGIRLRLVDGRELATLMLDTGLGVAEERVYRTYRIDNDFFEEEE
jgi:restriction system protein